ncbi:MAG: hypothetical protein JO278_15830 [Dyella sp.]|nr:hypothetical protein [Dyella sp.]
MAKVKIYVEKAFKLLGDDGKHTDYPVGNHTVEKETAEHWFVKAHTGDEPPTSPEMDAELAEQRAALDSAAQFLEGKAEQLKAFQEALDARASALADGEEKLAQREADLNARADALDAREAAIAEREKAADAAAKQTSKK